MIILGIDPGTATTGYGVICVKNEHCAPLGFGCITTSKDDPKEKRLGKIYKDLKGIIEKFKPDCLALEQLFFNKNIKTALLVGEARGVIMLAAAHCGVKVAEYTPLEVKEVITGYGRATKDQVKDMVELNLGVEKIKKDDAVDALAIALCHWFNMEEI